MSTFAQVGLDSVGAALWVIVGLLAGVFAGLVLRGVGSGVAQDIGAGVAGAVIGGSLLALTGPDFWGGLVGAFVGACAVISTMRELTPAPPRS